jgi:hypothetical protein
MFGSYPADFWTTANGIEALINYVSLTGDHAYAFDIPNTFNAVANKYFDSGYFDDQASYALLLFVIGSVVPQCPFLFQLWYANAWLREFEVSSDGNYLKQANTIVVEMLEEHDAWTPTCGGGVNWGINRNYKNTITNVLFGLACSKLYAYGLPGALGKGFDVWAQVSWGTIGSWGWANYRQCSGKWGMGTIGSLGWANYRYCSGKGGWAISEPLAAGYVGLAGKRAHDVEQWALAGRSRCVLCAFRGLLDIQPGAWGPFGAQRQQYSMHAIRNNCICTT